MSAILVWLKLLRVIAVGGGADGWAHTVSAGGFKHRGDVLKALDLRELAELLAVVEAHLDHHFFEEAERRP